MLKMDRNIKIDKLKGMAIVLVLIGHAIQQTTDNFLDTSYVAIAIYSFHMHLFFFLSGYLMPNRKISLRWLSGQFARLVLPIISWQYLIFLLKKSDSYICANDIIEPFQQWMSNPGGYFWFLWILFLCQVSFYNIKMISKNRLYIEFIVGVLFVFVLLLITRIFRLTWGNLNDLYFYLFFYLLGYWFSRVIIIDALPISIRPICSVISGLLWLGCFIVYLREKVSFDNVLLGNMVIQLIIRIALACFGIMFCWHIVDLMIGNLERGLSVIGKYSKEIYIIHTFIMPYFFLDNVQNIYNIVLKVITSLSISLVITFGVYNDYTRLLLLGSKRRK